MTRGARSPRAWALPIATVAGVTSAVLLVPTLVVALDYWEAMAGIDGSTYGRRGYLPPFDPDRLEVLLPVGPFGGGLFALLALGLIALDRTLPTRTRRRVLVAGGLAAWGAFGLPGLLLLDVVLDLARTFPTTDALVASALGRLHDISFLLLLTAPLWAAGVATTVPILHRADQARSTVPATATVAEEPTRASTAG